MSIVSLEDINAQIQKLEAQRLQLQAEAEKQRKAAMASVIQELIEKIDAYGITAKDLGLRVGKGDKAAKPQRVRKPLGAKVAGTGKTFTGPDGQPGIDISGYTMKNMYEEMSKGAYTVNGSATPWVEVPHSEAWYGASRCFQNEEGEWEAGQPAVLTVGWRGGGRLVFCKFVGP